MTLCVYPFVRLLSPVYVLFGERKKCDGVIPVDEPIDCIFS